MRLSQSENHTSYLTLRDMTAFRTSNENLPFEDCHVANKWVSNGHMVRTQLAMWQTTHWMVMSRTDTPYSFWAPEKTQ